MKISELVEVLQEAKEVYGDIEVHASPPQVHHWWINNDEQPPYLSIAPRLGDVGYYSPQDRRCLYSGVQ